MLSFGFYVYVFVQDPDFEWLMIDTSYIKVRPYASWCTRRLNSKIYLAVDAFVMPVDLIVTSGTTADSSQVDKLISDIEVQYLLADRACNTNSVIEIAKTKKMEAVILPIGIVKTNENTINTFLKLKRWRRIATRYAKTPHHTQLRYKSVICIYVSLA